MKRDRWRPGWWTRCKNRTSTGRQCRLHADPPHMEHRWWNSKGTTDRWWGL